MTQHKFTNTETIKMEVVLDINKTKGWFEVNDFESGGERWSFEGRLRFKDKKVTYYDGGPYLPKCVVSKLNSMGYDTSKFS